MLHASWRRFGIRGNVSHIPSSTARRASTMGCRVAGPLAWAMAPTANGNLRRNISLQPYGKYTIENHKANRRHGKLGLPSWTHNAAPLPPTAALNPIAATCISDGNSLVTAMIVDGKIGPVKKPTSATATAETMNCGTSQKTSSQPTAITRYALTAIRSPIIGVMKPSTTRPTVRPSQKPVAVIPEGNGWPLRTRIMKLTIQPPSDTGVYVEPTNIMPKY